MSAFAVEAEGLTRRFGTRAALRGVSLRLAPGERLALFGPNGSGKTTLLRVLATLLAPTSGTLRLFGRDPQTDVAAARRRIGFVGDRTLLEEALTSRENLAFYARLYDLPDARARVAEMLDRVGLGRRADEPVGGLSRGMQQRLALARALLHDPDLLLLDEAESGLDADGVGILADAIERPGRLRTLVLASHNVECATRLTDRALCLAQGRLIDDGAVVRGLELVG